jgi:DNA invertase Pin-like site-specific DNA recombinase
MVSATPSALADPGLSGSKRARDSRSTAERLIGSIAGLARARAQGKHLGRPKSHQVDAARAVALRAQGHSWRATARTLGVHVMAVRRAFSLSKSSPIAAS